jgi:hypothetical protein
VSKQAITSQERPFITKKTKHALLWDFRDIARTATIARSEKAEAHHNALLVTRIASKSNALLHGLVIAAEGLTTT